MSFISDLMCSMIFDWDSIAPRTVAPGFYARFIHSETMTFALWDIDAGAILPEHSHPHEQVTQMLSGEFELTLDGIAHHLGAGRVLIIPSHVTHSGRALTACKILDIFSPVREDYRF